MSDKVKLLTPLKPLANDLSLWHSFEEYVNFLLALNAKAMEQESDVLKIGRYQGKAQAYREMLRLREDARGLK